MTIAAKTINKTLEVRMLNRLTLCEKRFQLGYKHNQYFFIP
jgi:hypothetical protein